MPNKNVQSELFIVPNRSKTAHESLAGAQDSISARREGEKIIIKASIKELYCKLIRIVELWVTENIRGQKPRGLQEVLRVPYGKDQKDRVLPNRKLGGEGEKLPKKLPYSLK